MNQMVTSINEKNSALLLSIEAKKLYWEKSYELFEECESLRQSIVEVALYLDALIPGAPIPAKSITIPKLEAWAQQQSDIPR